MLPRFETRVSDIAFEDANKHFVSLMIPNGYPWVVDVSWIGAGKRFYPRINTTLEGCDTLFQGDKGQIKSVNSPNQPIEPTPPIHHCESQNQYADVCL